jgi:hypothetical protein
VRSSPPENLPDAIACPLRPITSSSRFEPDGSHATPITALKVQRKVSNGVAGLAAGGASLDRQKSRQFVPYSDAARWPNVGAQRLLKIPAARGPSCIPPAAQLKRE